MSASTPFKPVAPALSVFQSRWLAEALRRHEEAHGLLDDDAVLDEARTASTDFEARVRARAALLGARNGWSEAVRRSAAHIRLLIALAAVLALLAGMGTAAGVLGDGSRPVNVVWALGGLLGVHLLSLLLWGGGLLAAGAGLRPGLAPGLLGRGGAGLLGLLDRSPAAAVLPKALFGLLAPTRCLRWGASALSHGLWTLALAGAALTVLLLFASRRYGFVWETTILPADVFVELGAGLGRVPAMLGLPVPDAGTLSASGAAGALLDDGGRRAWAGWLLGSLLVYGLLPRVLLTLLCVLLWRRACARVRLDLGQPAYALLQARLMPASTRLGVSDPAPPQTAGQRHAAGRGATSGDRIALALELGSDLAWPPAFAEAAGDSRLDSREQRGVWLARLRARAPQRLLLAVDGRQTPDRGSLGLIAELAGLAGELRVWALTPPEAAHRLAQWREGLATLGLGADAGEGAADTALLVDAAAARAWLEAA